MSGRLRSNIWSAETLWRGTAHVTQQPNALLALPVGASDEELRSALQDDTPVLNTFEQTNDSTANATRPSRWFWDSKQDFTAGVERVEGGAGRYP